MICEVFNDCYSMIKYSYLLLGIHISHHRIGWIYQGIAKSILMALNHFLILLTIHIFISSSRNSHIFIRGLDGFIKV